MSGVEILATKEVAVEFVFNWLPFWCMVAAGVVIGLILGFHDFKEYGWSFVSIVAAICVFGGALIGALLGRASEKPIRYETQYKVTISDEVSMNDFLDEYEIVDQEGKIYTVREKE